MKPSVEYYSNLQKLFESKYGSFRNSWDSLIGVVSDDRVNFCRTYDMILDSLESMKSVDHYFIRNAFNKMYRDVLCSLDRIVNSSS